MLCSKDLSSATSSSSTKTSRSSASATMMDVLPLVFLLVMGVVISSTCSKYSSSSSQSSSSSSSLESQSQQQLIQELVLDSSSSHKWNSSPMIVDNDHHSQHQSDSSYSQSFASTYTSFTYLRRVMLANTSVTCNDGTVAGYYIRPAFGSRRWIVFLEGGWYCISAITCHQRWLKMRSLMTSAHWPEAKTVGGILSSSPEENPHWWNANHVFVPYCSSDIWSGDSPASSPGDLSFLGSRIVEQVITELLPRGLSDAKLLILAGSSAGAAGVMINLDRIAQLVFNAGSKAEVRGLADSGWILDNEPFNHHNNNRQPCIDAINCAPMDGIKAAHKLWSGRVPSSCQSQYPSEPWRCYFGYRLYPTLRAPLFIFQWLYDEAQMHMDSVSLFHSQQQLQYLHNLGQQIRATLENATAVFAPSCVSHIVLTKPDWHQVSINGISLPQAIRCWELNSYEPNKHDYFASSSSSSGNNNNDTVLADAPTLHRKKKKRRKQQRRRHKSKREQIIVDTINTNSNHNRNSHHYHHRSQTHANKYHHERHRWLRHEDLCHHWLMDSCNWPQCNRGCPKLHKNWSD